MRAWWTPVAGPGGQLSFWHVSKSGDFQEDCRNGARIAWDVMAEIRRTQNCSLLGWIVKEMKLEKFSGVEIGFLAAIAERAALVSEDDACNLRCHCGVVEAEQMIPLGSIGGDQAGTDQDAQQSPLFA